MIFVDAPRHSKLRALISQAFTPRSIANLGKVVLPMMGSANRDPKVFHDPNRFDIRRDPNPHIAFGHGIHFCLGAVLAGLEGRIALSDLLTRLRTRQQ